MSAPFLGQITIFAGNFAPRGYALCNGQLLSIASNTALFSILGTTYGGNGTSTFALPNLQGRVPIGAGTGAGLSAYNEGDSGGVESVVLNASQMPIHTHPVNATSAARSSSSPVAHFPSAGGYYGSTSGSQMAAGMLGNAGGNTGHENRQPYLAINYIIALQGIFPTRN